MENRDLYSEIYNMSNLLLAWRKARKFRNFYYHILLRKRNISNIQRKIRELNRGTISYEKFIESFQGWNAYAKWANSYNLANSLIKSITR